MKLSRMTNFHGIRNINIFITIIHYAIIIFQTYYQQWITRMIFQRTRN